MQAFDCSDPPGDAKPRLDGNQAVECNLDDPVWKWQLLAGSLVFIGYGIGVPCWLYRKLRNARADPAKPERELCRTASAHQKRPSDRLRSRDSRVYETQRPRSAALTQCGSPGFDVTLRYNDPHFQALFGWMLRKYSGDRYYWELVVTGRKLMIALVFLLMTKYPVFQLFASAGVDLVVAWFTVALRPYRCHEPVTPVMRRKTRPSLPLHLSRGSNFDPSWHLAADIRARCPHSPTHHHHPSRCTHKLDAKLHKHMIGEKQRKEELQEHATAAIARGRRGNTLNAMHSSAAALATKRLTPQAIGGGLSASAAALSSEVSLAGVADTQMRGRRGTHLMLYRGKAVSEKIVGKTFYKLLLARADLSATCKHFSVIDKLELSFVVNELIFLICAGVVVALDAGEDDPAVKYIGVVLYAIIGISFASSVYATRLLMRYRWRQHQDLRESLGDDYDKHFNRSLWKAASKSTIISAAGRPFRAASGRARGTLRRARGSDGGGGGGSDGGGGSGSSSRRGLSRRLGSARSLFHLGRRSTKPRVPKRGQQQRKGGGRESREESREAPPAARRASSQRWKSAARSARRKTIPGKKAARGPLTSHKGKEDAADAFAGKHRSSRHRHHHSHRSSSHHHRHNSRGSHHHHHHRTEEERQEDRKSRKERASRAKERRKLHRKKTQKDVGRSDLRKKKSKKKKSKKSSRKQGGGTSARRQPSMRRSSLQRLRNSLSKYGKATGKASSFARAASDTRAKAATAAGGKGGGNAGSTAGKKRWNRAMVKLRSARVLGVASNVRTMGAGGCTREDAVASTLRRRKAKASSSGAGGGGGGGSGGEGGGEVV